MRFAYLHLTALVCAILPVAQGQTDWPYYGSDPGGMRYSPLEQINTENVAKLQLAWTFETEAPITREAPPPPRPPSGAVSGAATPGGGGRSSAGSPAASPIAGIGRHSAGD